MKSKAQVTFVDKNNPLKIEDKTFYKTSFVDADGLQGTFYATKVMQFGDDIVVELVENGGKLKFKLSK